MPTVTIPGFIQAKPAHEWDSSANVIDGHEMVFMQHEDMKDYGYVLVCPFNMTFEMPEGWDPRAQQIEALKAKKEELQREFSAAVLKINQQIASLQAIEYTEAA
jgi:hypothetical protein